MGRFKRGKRRKGKFTIIDNSILKDKSLSWKAKGIISYMMSLPDDWELYTKELVKHATDGRDALMSGIRELKQAGYVIYNKWQDEEGKFHHDYTFYDEPQQEKPEVENPALDNPAVEKPSIIQRTNELRTNKLNTNNNSSSTSCTNQDSNESADDKTSSSKGKYPTLSKLPRPNGKHRKYPDKYEELYEAYPKRDGGANKGGGYKAFRARIKEGISFQQLLKGAENYYIEQARERKLNTKYVMQISTFLGTQDIWLEYAEKDLTKEEGNGKNKVSKGNGRKEKTVEEQKEEWRKDFANFSG